ncbi:hypothetical protein H4684_003698 [Desulfomicrobium macestii]|uniref:Uncharacterized protein n=1 Tax=Desulfomicrobium macestii TaxID=90731 RepID=A0ABR9H8G5_9BACT|nr:hypothetical protein [Desulfomicrobium macestii]MBE1427014.1 hypothetical protein [Desulfomicrobium macestii]
MHASACPNSSPLGGGGTGLAAGEGGAVPLSLVQIHKTEQERQWAPLPALRGGARLGLRCRSLKGAVRPQCTVGFFANGALRARLSWLVKLHEEL